MINIKAHKDAIKNLIVLKIFGGIDFNDSSTNSNVIPQMKVVKTKPKIARKYNLKIVPMKNIRLPNNNFQITFAKEGRFKQIGGSQFLELNFGETISVINNKITNFKFKKTDFNLSNFDDLNKLFNTTCG